MTEDRTPAPLSPYGVTKLTGEYLCRVYEHNHDVPVIILRFFTVYGPRQRPDMAFHRFIRSFIEDRPLTIHGDGLQTRDFTYIGDGVEAVAAAAYAPGLIGETVNIGGRQRASVREAIAILGGTLRPQSEDRMAAQGARRTAPHLGGYQQGGAVPRLSSADLPA